MDNWLHCNKPKQPKGRLLQEIAWGLVLRNPGSFVIFLHPPQSAQSSGRCGWQPRANVLHLYAPYADSHLAYTIYAFFEWALVLFDVGFDAVTALDFAGFELIVKDVKGASRGYVQWLPK